MKKALKIIGIVVAALLVVVIAYIAYVLIAYHRLGNGPLTVQGTAESAQAETDRDYTIVSYNIGFGAYEADYGFFMDGGTQS